MDHMLNVLVEDGEEGVRESWGGGGHQSYSVREGGDSIMECPDDLWPLFVASPLLLSLPPTSLTQSLLVLIKGRGFLILIYY